MAAALKCGRVLIVADSLALPRYEVGFEDTWPALLASAMPEFFFINRAARLATTDRLNGEGNQGADCLELFQPDIAVLQLGICDCAPRVFHPRVGAIMYRLPMGLGSTISAWLERWRGRKVANCYVSLHSYEKNLRAYLARAATCGSHVIAIATMPTSSLLEVKNPGIAAQVVAYNAVLNELASEFESFRVLHAFQGVEAVDGLFVDGLHLNGDGASLVAVRLESLIREIVTARVA